MGFLKKIFDPKYYEDAIDHLEKKLAKTKKLRNLEQGGVYFFNFYFEKEKIAKRIAKTVANGCYQFSPAIAHIADEPQYNITDRILRTVIGRILTESCETLVKLNVKGDFSHDNAFAMANLCGKFLQQRHAQSAALPGVFAWRGIINDYPSCIAVADDSLLWTQLGELLAVDYQQLKKKALWALLQDAIRPTLQTVELADFQTMIIANNNPDLAAAISQVYLYSFDKYLAAIPGGFYMRCANEFLLLHQDLEAIIPAITTASTTLQQLKLNLSNENSAFSYFSRQELKSEITCKTLHSIRFFDFWINYDGSVAIEKKHIALFLKKLTQRAMATRQLLGPTNQNELGKAICAALNLSMEQDPAFAQTKLRHLLRITDNKQLNDIDQEIADIVAAAVALKSVEKIPFWKIRKQWHLHSLKRKICN